MDKWAILVWDEEELTMVTEYIDGIWGAANTDEEIVWH